MSVEQFSRLVSLHTHTEIQKTRYLAFYYLRQLGVKEFAVSDVARWFDELQLGAPNLSRLRNRIRGSKCFIKGAKNGRYRLHAKEVSALEAMLPALGKESEAVVSTDTIIPESLVVNTRGFVESLARQINAAFEYNIYDGCAVLMRRLIEALLVLTYESKGLATEITLPDGSLKGLNSIIDDAVSNAKVGLTKDTRRCLHTFRTLGNLSAHKVHYNAKRTDVEKNALDFRAAVEELMYASGIRK